MAVSSVAVVEPLLVSAVWIVVWIPKACLQSQASGSLVRPGSEPHVLYIVKHSTQPDVPAEKHANKPNPYLRAVIELWGKPPERTPSGEARHFDIAS